LDFRAARMLAAVGMDVAVGMDSLREDRPKLGEDSLRWFFICVERDDGL
jgi:hypothetical protein